MQQQQQQRRQTPSAKRRAEAIEAGETVAVERPIAQAGAYPTAQATYSAALGAGVNPLAVQPTPPSPVFVRPPSEACALCTHPCFPPDVLEPLSADWEGWQARGGTAEGYLDRVGRQIDAFVAAPQRPPPRAAAAAERPTRRRRVEAQAEAEAGARNIVETILLDPDLRATYSASVLLGFIQAWSLRPEESELYSAYIQGQCTAAGTVSANARRRSGPTLCRRAGGSTAHSPWCCTGFALPICAAAGSARGGAARVRRRARSVYPRRSRASGTPRALCPRPT